LKISKDGINLFANKEYKKGEEIRYSLGPYTNDETVAR
jgi:hypothetical protein